MCGRFRQFKQVITPNVAATFNTAQGIRMGPFGIERGYYTNAREDSLQKPFWRRRNLLRGVLMVDGFTEGGKEFTSNQQIPIAIVVSPVQNVYSFAVVTTDSRFGVENYHDRMPAMLDNQYEWLHNGKLLIPLSLKLNAA